MRVGILGGGQLGWMTILEGRKLGFEFFVLDPDPKAPASRIADRWFSPEEAEDFIKACHVITYEFEHIEEDILKSLNHPRIKTYITKRATAKARPRSLKTSRVICISPSHFT